MHTHAQFYTKRERFKFSSMKFVSKKGGSECGSNTTRDCVLDVKWYRLLTKLTKLKRMILDLIKR